MTEKELLSGRSVRLFLSGKQRLIMSPVRLDPLPGPRLLQVKVVCLVIAYRYITCLLLYMLPVQ